MTHPAETEIKFLVPPEQAAALAAELARVAPGGERVSLAAAYLDTDDRRLAKAGLSWRLRREGRRWIQTLKAGGAHALERFEHEVIRPDGTPDAAAHAGTEPGERLARILRAAQNEGAALAVRCETEVERAIVRLPSGGAVVELAYDEGRLKAGDADLPLRELEFERVSGTAADLLALAQTWRERFHLIHEPRSKSERGDRLATTGAAHPPLRKALRPDYPAAARATPAFGRVLDECLAHLTRNVVGLCQGDPALRVGHVHQARVAIRRLRSALRCFAGWVPAPPDALVQGLRELFSELGRARDGDVLESGVVVELEGAGAPPVRLPAGERGVDPVAVVRSDATQRLLLAWLGWRIGLIEAAAAPDADPARPVASAAPAEPAEAAGDAPDDAGAGRRDLRRDAERRLRRWHRRIAADGKAFDALDEAALHALRKRIKRQRYAVEFFAPVLRAREVRRYLKPVTLVQERMGRLNDLFVARARYQPLVATDPAAWFAVGWITARIAELRAQAGPEWRRLARAEPPGS